MATLQSRLVLSLSDKVTGPLGRLSATLGRFQDQNRRLAAGLIPGGNLRALAGAVAGYAALTKGFDGTIGAASRFESAMNRVRAVSVGVGEDQIGRLESMARELGRTTKFTATEAALSIEMLKRNGLNVEQILGGAQKSTLALAAAAGSELAPAADLMTDVMNQFGMRADQTSGAVDQIAGVLQASKFAFNDYRLAAAQAGGVAGGLGIEFQDFNGALAATAYMFSSGSDAGTSFKTFLQRLTPESNKAAKAMKKLGLEFFGEDGSVKAIEDIAEELKEASKDLSEEEMTEYYKTIFGTDAIRTALALADAGRAGVRSKIRQIAEGDAQAMADARMRGYEGARKRFSSAMESLGISIGMTALPALTDFINALTPFVSRLSEAGSAADSAVSRIRAAFSGLTEGLGFADSDIFAGLKGQWREFETFMAGYDLSSLSVTERAMAEKLGAGRLQGLTDKFRELGEAIRGLSVGNLSGLGTIGGRLGELASAVSQMNPLAFAAVTGAIASLSRVLLGLTVALALSPIGRLTLLAATIQEMANAVKDARGLGDGVGKMFAWADSFSTSGKLGMLGLGAAMMAGGSKTGIGKIFGGQFKEIGGALGDLFTGKYGKGMPAGMKGPGVGMKAAGKAGLLTAGGYALWKMLTGDQAGAAEAQGSSEGAEPRLTRDMGPGEFIRNLPRLFSERINADPAGFEKRLDLLAPAITLGERLGAWIESLPTLPKVPADLQAFGARTPEAATRGELAKLRNQMTGYAGSVMGAAPKVSVPQITSRQSSGTDQPVAADPAKVQAEINALDGLYDALERIGELRVEGTGARGAFRESYLDPAQRSEYQALTAQVEAATASLPNVQAAVDAFIQAAASGGEQARSALEAARVAIDTAKAGLVAFRAETATTASSAQSAGQTITSSLNVTVAPTINTASLDAFVAKLGTALSQWRALQGATANISTKASGISAKVEARAKGGPVSAALPYLVGEKGPELFRPPTDGTIVPAHRTRNLLNGMRLPELRLGGLHNALQALDARSGEGGLGRLSGIFDALAERQEGAAMIGAFNAQPQTAAPAAAAPGGLGTLGGFSLSIGEVNVNGGTNTPASDIGRELGREINAALRRAFSDGGF